MAAPGEMNDLTFGSDALANFVLTDPGATITSTPPCITDPSGFATCPGPAAGVTNFLFTLGDGNDTVVVAPTASPYGTVNGGVGNDTLTGGTGPEKLNGDDGDDTLAGGQGPDDLSGGAGRDRADYATATAPVTVTLDGAANDGTLGEGDNVFTDIEDVTGGSAGDELVGDASDNRISGGDGADHLTGGLGHDLLDGGAGDDAIAADDGVADSITCGADIDTVVADALDTVSRNCEQVTRTGSGGGGPGSGSTGTGTPKPKPTGTTSAPLVSILQTAMRALRSVRGIVRVGLACRASGRARCKGDLSLRMTLHIRAATPRRKGSAAAARHHRRRVNIRLAHRRFSLRAGSSARLPVRLTRSAQARLVACRRLKVQIVASSRDAKGRRRTVKRAAILRASGRRRTTRRYVCS